MIVFYTRTEHQPPDYGQKVDDAADSDHLYALVPQVLQPLPQRVLPAVPHPKDQLVHHVAHLRKANVVAQLEVILRAGLIISI